MTQNLNGSNTSDSAVLILDTIDLLDDLIRHQLLIDMVLEQIDKMGV